MHSGKAARRSQTTCAAETDPGAAHTFQSSDAGGGGGVATRCRRFRERLYPSQPYRRAHACGCCNLHPGLTQAPKVWSIQMHPCPMWTRRW